MSRLRSLLVVRSLAVLSMTVSVMRSRYTAVAVPIGGVKQTMPAAAVRTAMRFVVRPGNRLAPNGPVLTGRSAVDQPPSPATRFPPTSDPVTTSSPTR